MSLTFGSLFAGIGGFDLGFERDGWQCKWQVEINEHANKVLAIATLASIGFDAEWSCVPAAAVGAPRISVTESSSSPTQPEPSQDRSSSGKLRWPTPTSRDHKGCGKNGRVRDGKIQTDTLDRAVWSREDSLKDGQLTPQFVEWVMGFEIGYSELPDSETQSSRKSRSSLREEYQKDSNNNPDPCV